MFLFGGKEFDRIRAQEIKRRKVPRKKKRLT